VDVCIVGAGFTGLWTAHYLLTARPDLSILILDAESVGFGASGRNGGWCSALLPQSADALAQAHGRTSAINMRRAMQETVLDLGRVTAAMGIDCDFERGGTVLVARNPAQMARAQAQVAHDQSWSGLDAWQLLSAAQVREQIGVPDALGGTFTPHCARLHPGKLIRGLAHAVEQAGATIAERTQAQRIAPGRVVTSTGVVSAKNIIRATEAWTARLPGQRRAIAPVYSLVISTAPLGPDFWQQAGLSRGQTFSDHRNVIVYGQRTADDRLVFGGRGAPYHFGSAISPEFDVEPAVFRGLIAALRGFFPYLGDVEVTHRWGGPLGISRDWHASVRYDPETGLGSAGGYVGDGVASTHLAGQTLADLVTEQVTERTGLPWVQHTSRSWEPEPLR
ncbi:MAG: NAD(P)/FAD-dependent oxidoreductase, partial [Angustibacter sp.]